MSQALKKTGGAITGYQTAVIELEGLENALRQLEAWEPNEHNIKHINAVRGMALACNIPLRDFLTKLEEYDQSLGAYSSPKWYHNVPQKSKWAVSLGQEVKEFREQIAAKTVSIGLLLAVNLSYVHYGPSVI